MCTSSGLLLFFGSYDLRFRHPWRSYAVMIRFDWFFVIAGITLPVLVFPVSSFRLVRLISAAPTPSFVLSVRVVG